MKFIATSVLSLAAASLGAAVPSIKANSVTFVQDESTRLVTISYELENAPAIVTVDIQTNGVSIGAENFRDLGGDVNMKVIAGKHQITWQPLVEWPSAPQHLRAQNAKAVVKAWACDDPPPYVIVDLAAEKTYRFYSCVEAIPGGLTNNVSYKMDKLVMRRIPAKNVTWRMGSPSTEPGSQWFPRGSEIPHYVMLTNDYYMGVFEFTYKQFQHITTSTFYDSTQKNPSSGYDTCPVNWLTIQDIRGENTGKIGTGSNMPADLDEVSDSSPLKKLRDLTGLKFNLPSDAQWEYACRAGTSTGFSNGKEATGWAAINDYAWTKDNANSSNHPVGLKLPNPWGLYDMYGNVGEYTLDAYTEGDDYLATFGANYQAGDTVVEPRNATPGTDVPARIRVVRGGRRTSDTFARLRSAGRRATLTSALSDYYRATDVGFRVVCPIQF